MNRQIRLLGVAMMGLFIVLFGALNYLQFIHAPALESNPLNTAKIISEYNSARGSIVSADGVTLADSVPAPAGSQFKYVRHYPTGALFGQLTGYYSFIYGVDGAEKTYNGILTGANDKAGFPTSISGLRRLLTQSSQAQNITLTLSDKLQALARSELAGRDGSVVALDPSTGAILAMYSNPSYDPQPISQLSTVKEQQAYKRILKAPGSPLVAGTYQQRWFPGSSFKIITAAAAYDHDPALTTKVYPTLSALPLPQTTTELHNFAGETCGGAILQLFTVSCDTGFGQMGLDLGAKSVSAEARAFGFDATPPIDLPFAAQSYFPPVASFKENLPTLAYSAIGQFDDQATPLQMAMVAGAIADKGVIMAPHILENVTNSQDQVISRYTDHVWKRATSAATAAKVTTLMESVVNSPDGTGTAAAIPGVEVAGKTGTAQTGTNPPATDDWFVAFAPAQHPTIAVAVLLPDQPDVNESQGGTYAAPIAKAMIEADLAGAAKSAPASTTTTAPPAPTAPTSTTPATTTPTTGAATTTTAPATTTSTSTTTTTSTSTSTSTTTPTTTPGTS